MSLFKHGRYSGYLRPISYIIDLSIIIGLSIFYLKFDIYDEFNFLIFTSLSWIIVSIASKFYEVYRYTREVYVLTLIIRQLLLFTLIVFAYFGFSNKINLDTWLIVRFIVYTFILITIAKFTVYYLLQKYRADFGGNFRTTVIIGENKNTHTLQKFFKENPEYGYLHKKTFSIAEKSQEDIESCFEYMYNENVDEIYCSLSELTNSQISEIVDFADNNLKILKFIPDNREIFSKKLKYEYYDYLPILSLRNIPLQDSINQVIKRIFDIIFSSAVIIFIMSWLTPLIAILIKIESKGPVFFKQTRNGFNYTEFDCYKFRSMTPNKVANLHQATRDDQRVTRIGRFIRKTSIDELPQFFNVLFGDMSVVGPRPHMVSHTNMYAKKIDKFMVRHFVKPGITGLAQVSGYRGEVESDKDIIGRVKYDIFYIENWSLLLDLKIVLQTFMNVVKGEEKAY